MKRQNKREAVDDMRSLKEITLAFKDRISNSDLSNDSRIIDYLSEVDNCIEHNDRAENAFTRIIYALICLLLFSLAGIFSVIDRNGALRSQQAIYQSRDSLFSVLLGIDSARTVTYQIRNDRPVTYPELISERDSLRSEYYGLLDEREEYRIKLEMITKNYPIRIGVERGYYVLHAEKIDSAMMLLSMYRDRISYDSEKGVWSVRR